MRSIRITSQASVYRENWIRSGGDDPVVCHAKSYLDTLKIKQGVYFWVVFGDLASGDRVSGVCEWSCMIGCIVCGAAYEVSSYRLVGARVAAAALVAAGERCTGGAAASWINVRRRP